MLNEAQRNTRIRTLLQNDLDNQMIDLEHLIKSLRDALESAKAEGEGFINDASDQAKLKCYDQIDQINHFKFYQ